MRFPVVHMAARSSILIVYIVGNSSRRGNGFVVASTSVKSQTHTAPSIAAKVRMNKRLTTRGVHHAKHKQQALLFVKREKKLRARDLGICAHGKPIEEEGKPPMQCLAPAAFGVFGEPQTSRSDKKGKGKAALNHTSDKCPCGNKILGLASEMCSTSNIPGSEGDEACT